MLLIKFSLKITYESGISSASSDLAWALPMKQPRPIHDRVLENELCARLYSQDLMRAIRMRQDPAIVINCAVLLASGVRKNLWTKRQRKKLEISSNHLHHGFDAIDR